MYWPQSTCDALRSLRACGWEWFELSTEHLAQLEEDSHQRARIEEVLSRLAELGLRMPQAHAHLPADIADPDESRREADMHLLHRQMACCAALRIEHVVVHPGTGGGYTIPDEFQVIRELNLRNCSRLADRAAELGLKVCLENSMDHHGKRNFGARPEELLELLAELDHPALGICLDTSHANVQKLDCAAAIRSFSRLLCCTHISDNDGSGDQHLTPGGGNINWPSVTAALRQIGYDGMFNLEIPGEMSPEPDILALKTRHARGVAERLVQRI